MRKGTESAKRDKPLDGSWGEARSQTDWQQWRRLHYAHISACPHLSVLSVNGA